MFARPSIAALCLAVFVESCDSGVEAAVPESSVDARPSFDPNLTRSLAEAGTQVRDGPTTLWSEGGVKLGEGEMKMGLKHGPWRFFHSDGALRWSGSFVRGVPHGRERAWHANGQLELDGERDHGRRTGLYRMWYESGRLELEAHYRDDRLHGTCRRFTLDGRLDEVSSGTFENGRKTGPL